MLTTAADFNEILSKSIKISIPSRYLYWNQTTKGTSKNYINF
ncbi:hypothetical protein [Candidatus Hodgkinia cicadicola]